MSDHFLDVLGRYQPLPPESELTSEQIDNFEEARLHFAANQDDRCVPLLVGAVNSDSGFGVYQMVEDALRNQSQPVVVSELSKALQEGKEHHLVWVLEWAAAFKAFELEGLVASYVSHSSDDVSLNAKLFINLCREEEGQEIPYPNLFE